MIVFTSTYTHSTATKRTSKSGATLSMHHYTSTFYNLATKQHFAGPSFSCLSNSTKKQIDNANIKAYEASATK